MRLIGLTSRFINVYVEMKPTLLSFNHVITSASKTTFFKEKFLLPTLFHFYWYLKFILRKIAWKLELDLLSIRDKVFSMKYFLAVEYKLISFVIFMSTIDIQTKRFKRKQNELSIPLYLFIPPTLFFMNVYVFIMIRKRISNSSYVSCNLCL